MKILVLGGTGFVGRTVLETLKCADMEAMSVSRSEGCDLRRLRQTAEMLKTHRPDLIINCAAHVGSLHYVTEQAADVVIDNTKIALNVYQGIASECPGTLVINPIANCAYPATANTFEEDHWWDGHLHRSVFSYGSTRRMLWCIAECFQMQHGIRSINFLVPNMYGPYDSTDPNKAHALNALTAKFVKAKALGQREVPIWGTGAAVREWLYAGDFARAVLEIIRNPGMMGLHEPINIGQNFGLSVRELVSLIMRTTGYNGRVQYDHSMPDGAPRKVMDDRRFRKVFPNFEFTPLEVGIEATIRYYERVYPY